MAAPCFRGRSGPQAGNTPRIFAPRLFRSRGCVMSVHTSSLWLETLANRPDGALSGDPVCDVCVVGAGIAGLTTAYLLAGEDKSVVLLEARSRIGEAETGHTTAHLSSVIDDRFSSLQSARGTEVTRLAYQAHAAAI